MLPKLVLTVFILSKHRQWDALREYLALIRDIRDDSSKQDQAAIDEIFAIEASDQKLIDAELEKK